MVALLSLPNLLVGVMAVVIRHTFATFNPLQIVNDFFFQMFWGEPLTGLALSPIPKPFDQSSLFTQLKKTDM